MLPVIESVVRVRNYVEGMASQCTKDVVDGLNAGNPQVAISPRDVNSPLYMTYVGTFNRGLYPISYTSLRKEAVMELVVNSISQSLKEIGISTDPSISGYIYRFVIEKANMVTLLQPTTLKNNGTVTLDEFEKYYKKVLEWLNVIMCVVNMQWGTTSPFIDWESCHKLMQERITAAYSKALMDHKAIVDEDVYRNRDALIREQKIKAHVCDTIVSYYRSLINLSEDEALRKVKMIGKMVIPQDIDVNSRFSIIETMDGTLVFEVSSH